MASNTSITAKVDLVTVLGEGQKTMVNICDVDTRLESNKSNPGKWLCLCHFNSNPGFSSKYVALDIEKVDKVTILNNVSCSCKDVNNYYEDWQRYIGTDYSKKSLPEIVHETYNTKFIREKKKIVLNKNYRIIW